MTTKKQIFLRVILFGLPFIIIVILIAGLFTETRHYVFPGRHYTYKTISDSIIQGNSVILEENIGTDSYFIRYILKDRAEYPYVTMTFSPKKLLNLERFDSIKCIVETTTEKKIRIYVLCYDPSFSDKKNIHSYVRLAHEIFINENQKEYNISFDDLAIPEWWYDVNNVVQDQVSVEKSFSNVGRIEISSSYTPQLNVESSIKVHQVFFYKSNRALLLDILLITGLYCLYICILLLYRYFKNKRKKKKYLAVEAYRELDHHLQHDEAEEIILYIGNNFGNRDLTVAIVACECNVHEYKISQVIKDRFNITFPQYLNMIRLTEAKRLLTETNLRITEISYSVGYSSYEHFNRIFKKNEHVSPAQYRKIHS